MGGKKKYIEMFGSFTEPFSCPDHYMWMTVNVNVTYCP